MRGNEGQGRKENGDAPYHVMVGVLLKPKAPRALSSPDMRAGVLLGQDPSASQPAEGRVLI